MAPSCYLSTCFFGVLAFIGLIILIVVGTTVVSEYNTAKDFIPTECRLLRMEELGLRDCQYCYTTYTMTRRNGKSTRTSKSRCRPSAFPCVRMVVSYHFNWTGTFFKDATMISPTDRCSFYVCGASPSNNEVKIKRQMNDYRIRYKYPFPCYFSHEFKYFDMVIGRKIYSYNSAFHGMLWPSIITAIGIVGVLVTMYDVPKKICKRKKGEDDSNSDSDSSNREQRSPDGTSIPLTFGENTNVLKASPEKTPLSEPSTLDNTPCQPTAPPATSMHATYPDQNTAAYAFPQPPIGETNSTAEPYPPGGQPLPSAPPPSYNSVI